MTDVGLIYAVAEWKTLPMSLDLNSEYRRGYWYIIREPVFDKSIEAIGLYRFQNIMLAGVMHEVISTQKQRYKIQQICLEGFPMLEVTKSFPLSNMSDVFYQNFIAEATSIFNDYCFERFNITHVHEMSIYKLNSMKKESKNATI